MIPCAKRPHTEKLTLSARGNQRGEPKIAQQKRSNDTKTNITTREKIEQNRKE
jgi:hypothetical protein